MKDLPEEVLDEIIGHLPPGDRQSFKNCSPVAKSWIYPSRRRLLEVVDTLKESTLWSWLNYVSPNNVELLQHVRCLSVRVDSALHQGTCANLRRVDTPFFPRLKHLDLYSGSPSAITQLAVSLAVNTPSNASACTQYCCRVTISTLTTLVNHLPNLVHLKLYGIIHDVDGEPIPPLRRPLRKLSVDEPNSLNEPGILDQLLELRPQCDDVSISACPAVAPSLTQRIVDGVDATVKYLSLKTRVRCECGKNLSLVLLT